MTPERLREIERLFHDARERTPAERDAFLQVEAVLGNAAPRIADFGEVAGRGGLRYRYAAMGRGPAE